MFTLQLISIIAISTFPVPPFAQPSGGGPPARPGTTVEVQTLSEGYGVLDEVKP